MTRSFDLEMADGFEWDPAIEVVYVSMGNGGAQVVRRDRSVEELRAIRELLAGLTTSECRSPSKLVSHSTLPSQPGADDGRKERSGVSSDDLEHVIARTVDMVAQRAAPAADITEWMTPEQIADWLGYKRSYIAELVRRHGLPCHRCGRLMRFRRIEVEDWAERRGRR